MIAQKLYDFREEWEFCSGVDLHGFFETQVGDPSPSGKVEINPVEATRFVMQSLVVMESNSSSLATHCNSARNAWQ